MRILNNHRGFTVIELLIASTVFSTVLLLCAIAVIAVGKLFYKGITSSATQEVSRSAMGAIQDDFELSGGYFRQLTPLVVAPGGPTNTYNGFCIGSHLYSYQIGRRIDHDGSGHALVVRDKPSCDLDPTAKPDDISAVSSPDPTRPWRELLGPNMRLGTLLTTIPPPPASQTRPQALSISINVIAGEDDLINALGGCNGGAGSQFCASSPLSTYALRRIR